MNKTNLSPNLPQLAALIKATPQTLRSQLNGLGPEILSWHPAPGEWCINEAIGHLIEADRRGFAGRIEMMLAEERPLLRAWDQPAVAAQRGDCEREASALIAELEALRAESARLVAGLDAAQLARAGLHPHVGELRVIDIINEWVHHDCRHLKQIMTNIQAYVWPQMGRAQRFSEIM